MTSQGLQQQIAEEQWIMPVSVPGEAMLPAGNISCNHSSYAISTCAAKPQPAEHVLQHVYIPRPQVIAGSRQPCASCFGLQAV
jgi:hypothetical protein